MLTVKGYRDLFILVLLHVESRRVVLSPSTFNPKEAWVTGQAREFVSPLPDLHLDAQTIMHDRDTKFTTSFDEIFAQAKIDVVKSAFRSPNTMAYVERFIQTLKHECLQYFIVFGREHMDHLLSVMVSYYHEERPHQAQDNNLLLHVSSSKSSPKRKKKKVTTDNDGGRAIHRHPMPRASRRFTQALLPEGRVATTPPLANVARFAGPTPLHQSL